MRHNERSHALLSASSSHRWLGCTPSAMMEAKFPDSASEAAKEGTLAHELAEIKIRHYFQTVDFGRQKYSRRVNKLKQEEFWQDEMEGFTEEYLDHIKSVALSLKVKPYVAIEQKLDLTEWVPEGFGTADCIFVYGDTVHVFDFKYGKGVQVNAENNPQMMLYALGAYGTYKMLYLIKNIRMTIVQPRIDNISEWECTLEDLLRFGEYVKERAALAIKGEGTFSPGADVCRFCKAKAVCRARADESVRLAFHINEKPPLIGNDEVGRYLSLGEDVDKWLKDLKDYALSECLKGNSISGWKAVEGRGSRDWTDMDAAFEKLQREGIDSALLWERKPLSLAQVEKMVGKKEFSTMVGDMVIKNPGKPALVRDTDKREAITNKITAKEAFGEQ